MSAIGIVVTKLKTTAGVTALVPSARIYPVIFPQGVTAPAIVVNIVGGRDEQMLTGAGKFYEHRVSVECLAVDGSTAVAIGDAVMAALQDVVKATIAGHAGTDVAFADTDVTDYADDRSLARRILHFRVRWR